MITMEIVRFCAIECKMQMSGELSVWHMLQAWEYAQENADPDKRGIPYMVPTVSDVLEIGRLVEPNVNHGFRKVDVRVGWDVKMPWEDVPHFMVELFEKLQLDTEDSISNEDFIYQGLGVCHPFRDGNGRTFQILWNWLNGTLDHPVWHKDFWSDPRRTVGYGA